MRYAPCDHVVIDPETLFGGDMKSGLMEKSTCATAKFPLRNTVTMPLTDVPDTLIM